MAHTIKFELLDRDMQAPARGTAGSAGVDLRARHRGTLQPGERALVPTGIKVAVPEGHVGDLRPRSGTAFRNGVTVLNAPGTIDSDYRGEVAALLINHGAEPFTWNRGDRIAQFVVVKADMSEWEEVEELTDDTDRGAGGFGSTGRE